MPACLHSRTRLVAKDKDAEYVECLDCGAVLEVEELPRNAADQAAPKAGSDPEERPSESLSDA